MCVKFFTDQNEEAYCGIKEELVDAKNKEHEFDCYDPHILYDH